VTVAPITTLIGISGFKQLDGVVGKGSAITAFVRQYAPHWRHITFTTVYDGLLQRGGYVEA